MEVVVEIPASKSKRGWNYTKESLKNIVDYVNTKTLNGFLGHQKPDEVSNKFVPPATHWIGAKMEGNNAYFRGLIDKSAQDLKRWVRTGRIKEVSIFGYPKLEKVKGETNVVGYEPLSIDWTPLHRPGMQTSIVAMEMGDKNEEESMDKEELLKSFKEMLSKGEISKDEFRKLLGEEKQEPKNDPNVSKEMEELKKELGISGEMDLTKVFKNLLEDSNKLKKTEQEEIINSVIKEKVAGEMNQALVKKMLKTSDNATKEIIIGEIDALLKDEDIKKIISSTNISNGIYTGTPGGNGSTNYKVKKVSI